VHRMPPTPRAVATAALGAAVLVAAPSLGGCSRAHERTALVATSPRWLGVDRIEVEVECAARVEASVRPGAGHDGLPLVTVWGEPRAGRCRVPVALDLPAGTERIDDAASGMVVDLPPRPEPGARTDRARRPAERVGR